jgi:sigma-B regulation protein RsbU (phosphoserine phosphatase)
MADVTGHAMEAAIPVVMFNGILQIQSEEAASIEDLFHRLNRSLAHTLERRKFICFSIAEINLIDRSLRFSNGGCPYPILYRSSTGKLTELQADGYPLGIRTDTTYKTIGIQLAPGDRLVFFSDGIPEAINAERELFGYDRINAIIQAACGADRSADEVINHLIGEVTSFIGNVSPEDDMTCVVVAVNV